MAIDTTATRAMSSLLDSLLQMGSMAQQNRWREDELALGREFQKEQTELNIAAQNFQTLRQRRFALEDEMKGYTLPYQTKKGKSMIDGTLQTYETGAKSELTRIDQLTQSLTLIADAKDFAKGKEAEFGALIPADEGEEFRDYMLEGTIQRGPAGTGEAITGTGEMALWLGKQSPETLKRMQDPNFQRSFERSLRSVEEAKTLQQIDQQLYTGQQQADAATLAIKQGKYDFAIKINEEFERNMGEIYKNTSLSIRTDFQYISGGVRYKIPDLQALAATDVDKFMKVKQKFLDDPLNRPIADEADAFISGIETAAAAGLDPSEWAVRFQFKAYSEFLKLEEYKRQLTEAGKLQDRSLKDMMAYMPNGETQREITRLKARVSGFKRLGLYTSSKDMLDRTYAVVLMHNEQQAKRLAMDIEASGRVSDEGLQISPIETYEQQIYDQLTPKELKDLEWSFEAIQASGGYGDEGVNPYVDPLGALGTIPAVQNLRSVGKGTSQSLYNIGAGAMNIVNMPINQMMSQYGYNPGLSGERGMDLLLGWTGASAEAGGFDADPQTSQVGPITQYTPAGGQFSWEDEPAGYMERINSLFGVEDSLNQLDKISKR